MGKSIKIAAVCIGDELLKGFTVNTNLSDIGSNLLASGFSLEKAIVIPDTKALIQDVMEDLLRGGMDIVIFTGGLGPTVDDLTKPAVAEALGLKLLLNDVVAEHLRLYWSRRDRQMSESVMSQAFVPEGAECFPNEVGTAPGLLINISGTCRGISKDSDVSLPCVILLPGPPGEMKPMLRKYVIPYLESITGFDKIYTDTLHVAGLPESRVEQMTLPLIEESGMNIAYCASPEAVKVYISGNNRENLNRKVIQLREKLTSYVLPEGTVSSVDDMMKFCLDKNISLAVAESCTGGLIASAITDISGASRIFKGGIVSYSNEWKHELLGVAPETLEKYGAVSYECASEMVINLCGKYETDAGISVTGIAGPGGGTVEKPVGLVFIGAKFRDMIVVKEFNFPGNRERVRQQTLYTACNLLRSLFHSG